MKKMSVLLVALFLLTLQGCFSNDTVTEEELKKDEKLTTENQTNAGDSVATKAVFSGVVVDQNGEPIEGALISIAGKETKTIKGGSFQIAGLDIGGATSGSGVTMNATITKDNYISMSAHVEYTEDTLTGDDESVEIKIDSPGTVQTGEDGTLTVGTVLIPISNAQQNVRVEMVELLTLKGKVDLPETISTDASIMVKPTIMGSSYPKSDYTEEISDSLEYTIEDIPASGSQDILLEIYLNENKYAEYYAMEDGVSLLAAQKNEVKGEQRFVNYDFEAKKYGTVKGKVFKTLDKSEIIPAGAKVILNKYDGSSAYEEVDSTTVDSEGNYVFREVIQGNYQVELKDFDAPDVNGEGDGNFEYINGKTFNDIAVIDGENSTNGTTPTTVVKNLWYEGAYDYNISGKVEVGIKGDTIEGIKVKLLHDNASTTAQMDTIDEVTTTSDGAFAFEGIEFKNVKVVAEEIDTDDNLVVNFNQDSEVIYNEKGIDVEVDLFMYANSDEYGLHVVSTNYTKIKEDRLVVIDNAIEPDANIEVTFDNPISLNSKTEIETYDDNGNIVNLEDMSGNELDITYSLSSDKKTVTIDPVKDLKQDNYIIKVNSKLDSEYGYKYEIGNTIDADTTLIDIPVDTNYESYTLMVSGGSFLAKDEYGTWGTENLLTETVTDTDDNKQLNVGEELTVNFNLAVSTESALRIINKGENVVSLNDVSDGKEILATYEFSSDRKTMTIVPAMQNSLETGKVYEVNLHADLKSVVAENADFDLKLEGFKTFQGDMFKSSNATLSAIKPEIFVERNIYEEYNTSGSSLQFAMDYDLSKAGIYENANLKDTVQTYSPVGFNLELDLSTINMEEIKEFRVYGDTGASDSYWTVLKTINSSAVTKTDEILGYKNISVDLTQVKEGYDLGVEQLKWENKIYLTVVPVDNNGKLAINPAEVSADKILTLGDNYGVKISNMNTDKALDFGENTITFNEPILPTGRSVDITGYNSNIGLTKSSPIVGADLTELKIDVEPSVIFTYDSTTTYNHSEADNPGRLEFESTDGMYEGMKLVSSEGDFTINKVRSGTVIDTDCNFDIPKSTEFTVKDDAVNNGIFDRTAETTSILNVTSSITSTIINQDIDVNTTTAGLGASAPGGTIILTTTNTDNPNLGIEVGDELTFKSTGAGSDVTVTVDRVDDNDKIVTQDDISDIGSDYYLSDVYQVKIEPGEASNYVVGEEVELTGATNTMTIMAIDTTNGLIRVSSSADGATAINLKTVKSSSVILTDNVSYAVGDKIFLNPDKGSTVEENGVNLEAAITGLQQKTAADGTSEYLEVALSGVDLTGLEKGKKVIFKPTIEITITAKDSSNNDIINTDKSIKAELKDDNSKFEWKITE
ncbi:MAG: hypothetical protein ACQERZ_05165 [Fusobacteriota bacterium]